MLQSVPTAIEKGLGLKPQHQRLLIRVGWVLAVSFHIAWVCGLLTPFLAAPFARASDVDKLMRAAEVNARISMQQELRVQVRAWCTSQDPELRTLAYRRIYELRNDLREIARIETPEPSCVKEPEPQP